MKQTAVEWLYDRFLYAGYAVNSEWKEQAKEMEKEQIIDANIAGMEFIPVDPNRYQEDAEQYYNETFNTKDKDELYDDWDVTLNDGIED
jgi:hypothetical protein